MHLLCSDQQFLGSQFQREKCRSTQIHNPSMPTTEDFKETVKQQADIVRIIGDYIKLKKAGAQNYSGLCPFHGEKTPSFSVHATRQFYHCFGCGVSGDVFSFVQKIENITFPESVRLVAQKLGIPLPKATYSSPGEARDAKLRAQLFDIQERAAAFFQECLKRPEGARAREYLAGRGLDVETIARFRIGYAPDSGFLLRDRLMGEFSEEVLRESGVFSWKQEDSRQPTEGSARTKNTEGAPSLSVRSLDGQGGDFHSKLLGRFSKNAVVNFDPDTAGAKATERTLGLLVEEEFQIKVLTLEQGFDPDLYIRRKGKDAYGEALRSSQKYFDYLIDRARSHFPVRSAEGKVKAVNFLLPHIQRVPSRIVRDELGQEIAQKLGIDSTVLRQELRHVASQRSAAAVKAPPEAQATDAERILVRALASARQMQPGTEHLSARDGAEEEFDPARQAQYAFQSEALHRGLAAESLIEALLNAGTEIADVMEVPCSEGERRMLASILLKEDEELTAERLEGAVRALRRIHLRRRLEQVQRELTKPGVGDDKVLRNELLLEKDRLSRALRDPSLAEDGLRMTAGNKKSA